VSDSTDLLDAPSAGAGDPAAEPTATKPARKTAARKPGLSGMVLAELQGLAAELGITGTARMRKGQLIEAIKERQGGSADAPRAGARDGAGPAQARAEAPAATAPAEYLR